MPTPTVDNNNGGDNQGNQTQDQTRDQTEPQSEMTTQSDRPQTDAEEVVAQQSEVSEKDVSETDHSQTSEVHKEPIVNEEVLTEVPQDQMMIVPAGVPVSINFDLRRTVYQFASQFRILPSSSTPLLLPWKSTSDQQQQPPQIVIEEIVDEINEEQTLDLSEDRLSESDSETQDSAGPIPDVVFKERLKRSTGTNIGLSDLLIFVDEMTSAMETKSQKVANQIKEFTEHETHMRQTGRSSTKAEIEALFSRLNTYVNVVQKNSNEHIQLIRDLITNALGVDSINRKHFDSHFTQLHTDRDDILKVVSQLSNKVDRQQSENQQAFRQIQEFMQRIDSRLGGNDDKKGEKEKGKGKEQEISKQRQMHFQTPVQTDAQTLLMLKTEESERLFHDPQLNPYKFLPSELSSYNIHNDDRYKACVDKLSPKDKEAYDNLMKQRESFLLSERKKLFHQKYGSKKGMSDRQVRDLSREISVPPPNPVWLFPYPHIRGTEISVNDPAPAPWPPTFNWSEHLKLIREEATAREKRIREDIAAREKSKYPRR